MEPLDPRSLSSRILPLTVPEPPSFNSFQFNTIGRAPGLLNRMSDVHMGSESSENRWRSESPQSPLNVDEGGPGASDDTEPSMDVDTLTSDEVRKAGPQSLLSRLAPSRSSPSATPSVSYVTPIQTRISHSGDRHARPIPITTKRRASHSPHDAPNQNPHTQNLNPQSNSEGTAGTGNTQLTQPQVSPSRARSPTPDLGYPPTPVSESPKAPASPDHSPNLSSMDIDRQSASNSGTGLLSIPNGPPHPSQSHLINGAEVMDSTIQAMVQMGARLQNTLSQMEKSKDLPSDGIKSPSLHSLKSQSPTASPKAALGPDFPTAQVQVKPQPAGALDDSQSTAVNPPSGSQSHKPGTPSTVAQIEQLDAEAEDSEMPPQSAVSILSPQLRAPTDVQLLSVVPHDPPRLSDTVSPSLLQWIDDAPRARAELKSLSTRISVAESAAAALRAELASAGNEYAKVKAEATESASLLAACQLENVALRDGLSEAHVEVATLRKLLEEKGQQLQRDIEKRLRLKKETDGVLNLARRCIERIEELRAESNPDVSATEAGVPAGGPSEQAAAGRVGLGIAQPLEHDSKTGGVEAREQRLAQRLREERAKRTVSVPKSSPSNSGGGSALDLHTDLSGGQSRLQVTLAHAPNTPTSNRTSDPVSSKTPTLTASPLHVQAPPGPIQLIKSVQGSNGPPLASRGASHNRQDSSSMSSSSVPHGKDNPKAPVLRQARPAAQAVSTISAAPSSRSNISVKAEMSVKDIKKEDEHEHASSIVSEHIIPPAKPQAVPREDLRPAYQGNQRVPTVPNSFPPTATATRQASTSNPLPARPPIVQSHEKATSHIPSSSAPSQRTHREVDYLSDRYDNSDRNDFLPTSSKVEHGSGRGSLPGSHMAASSPNLPNQGWPTYSQVRERQNESYVSPQTSAEPATGRSLKNIVGDGGWPARVPNARNEPKSVPTNSFTSDHAARATNSSNAYRPYDHYSPPQSPQTPPLPPPQIVRRATDRYSPPPRMAQLPTRSPSPEPHRPRLNRKRYRSRSRSIDRYSPDQDHPPRRTWQGESQWNEYQGPPGDYHEQDGGRDSRDFRQAPRPPSRPLTPPGATIRIGQGENYRPAHTERIPPRADIPEPFNQHRRASDSYQGKSYDPRPANLLDRMDAPHPVHTGVQLPSKNPDPPSSTKGYNLLDRMSETGPPGQKTFKGENTALRKPVAQTYAGSPRGRGQGKTTRGRGAGRGVAPPNTHNALAARMQPPRELVDRISSK
ncbi:hypothetical protein HWV62_23234 [Athelia sp. TMB]|nr:hypothetical protein HWV62_23234 [Athelia sp. TMB]